MNKVTEKLKILSYLLLSFIALGILFTIVRKNINDWEKSKNELYNLQIDLNNLDKISEETENRKDDISHVLGSIPQSYEEISQYAKKLDYLAGQLGLTIDISFDETEKKESNGLNSLEVNIKTKGGYLSIVDFVNKLSELPYHIEVDTLKFNKIEGVVSLDFTYRLYSYIRK